MNDTEQLYSLLTIFKILATTDELNPLSSSSFLETFWLKNNGPMQKALQHILQNFQKRIQVKDLLNITNMSNTTFYTTGITLIWKY